MKDKLRTPAKQLLYFHQS